MDPSSTATHQQAFHASEPDEVAGYRRLSGLAVIGLLFGLAAPLCFAAPVLIAVPLVGMAISLIALRQISAPGSGLSGSWAAAVGLALCIASIAATFSHLQFVRFLHTSQARRFGQQWLEMVVHGRLNEAFQRTVASTRPDEPEPPGMAAGTKPSQPPYDQFINDPFIQALGNNAAAPDVRFVTTLLYEPRAYRQCLVRQKFSISRRSKVPSTPPSAAGSVDAVLTLQRSRLPGESRDRWLVLAYARAEPEADGSDSH